MLYALGLLSDVISIISWFVILFTGSLPDSLAGCSTSTSGTPTALASYATFLREEYPPFTST